MRDLKHLIAFENLLQEANNELVRQGKADGKRAPGTYDCSDFGDGYRIFSTVYGSDHCV